MTTSSTKNNQVVTEQGQFVQRNNFMGPSDEQSKPNPKTSTSSSHGRIGSNQKTT